MPIMARIGMMDAYCQNRLTIVGSAKVLRLRECLPQPAMIDTPERAVEYWRANIPCADWFDPAKEAFVVLVLNTRKRIIGHNLVSIGTLDSCHVHSREVFRPVIVAAG